MNDAPRTIAILVCPVCGRTDRYQTFIGKRHFVAGKVCEGTPERIVYVRRDP